MQVVSPVKRVEYFSVYLEADGNSAILRDREYVVTTMLGAHRLRLHRKGRIH